MKDADRAPPAVRRRPELTKRPLGALAHRIEEHAIAVVTRCPQLNAGSSERGPEPPRPSVRRRPQPPTGWELLQDLVERSAMTPLGQTRARPSILRVLPTQRRLAINLERDQRCEGLRSL